MKYFSEDSRCINAECESCGKVLSITRGRCSSIDGGYKLEPAVKCFCGNISDMIIKTGEAVISDTHHSSMKNLPRCPTCGSTNIHRITSISKVGKVALFGIFALGAVGKTFKCNSCGYQW